jgi:hypothetical protein
MPLLKTMSSSFMVVFESQSFGRPSWGQEMPSWLSRVSEVGIEARSRWDAKQYLLVRVSQQRVEILVNISKHSIVADIEP